MSNLVEPKFLILDLPLKRAIELSPEGFDDGFGIVYALRTANGLVKIGKSKKPKARIRSQAHNLKALGVNPVTSVSVSIPHVNYSQAETHLHTKFRDLCVSGELFKVTLTQIIEALNTFNFESTPPRRIDFDLMDFINEHFTIPGTFLERGLKPPGFIEIIPGGWIKEDEARRYSITQQIEAG